MTGKIVIDIERCKGCGLCVAVCPKNGITLSKKSNKSGYFPAEVINSDSFDKLTTSCTGCAICALVCPDVAIEVQRDDSGKVKIVTKPDRKSKPRLIEEKT